MNSMPPTPFKQAIVDKFGMLSRAWQSYFVELYERIAGDPTYNSTFNGSISGVRNGSNHDFITTDEFIVGSEVVSVVKDLLTSGEHYTFDGKNLDLVTAPSGGQTVTVRGRKVARRPNA